MDTIFASHADTWGDTQMRWILSASRDVSMPWVSSAGRMCVCETGMIGLVVAYLNLRK